MDERGCLLLPDAEVDKKREQEWQPKTAAAEEPDKKDTSGAVQTEESPKRDDADAKPFGTSKHIVYFPTRRIVRAFARLVLKIQKIVCRCILT